MPLQLLYVGLRRVVDGLVVRDVAAVVLFVLVVALPGVRVRCRPPGRCIRGGGAGRSRDGRVVVLDVAAGLRALLVDVLELPAGLRCRSPGRSGPFRQCDEGSHANYDAKVS